MGAHSHPAKARGGIPRSVCEDMRRVSLCLGLVLTTAACTGGATSDTTHSMVTTTTAKPVAPIKWKPCPLDEALKCARLSVPFDYTDPSKGAFSLKLVMHPADEASRIGSMLVNPGGPGYGGSFLAEDALSYFGEKLVRSFDIVGWDPRGTGDSTPAVDCVDSYDEYFAIDPTPENEQQRAALVAASKSFAEACETRSGKILQWISTNNSARDMDSIRAALGEDTITYFGFSYGSELGATWATLFPRTVRAAVLDGAVDPTAGYMDRGLQQAVGFEGELAKFLARCSADPKCVFHNKGKAEAAFDALMERLDSRPLTVSKDRAKVNRAVALTGVIQAMYTSTMWDTLAAALASAQQGDGSGLLALNDDYYERSSDGTYGNELEAFVAISCLDDPGPTTVQGVDAYADKFKAAAPRLWPGFTDEYPCVFWPARAEKRVPLTGAGAGPILVIGTTGDAATPLSGTRNMAKNLEDGRLIVVDANRHTGYGVNSCVVDATDAYLVTTEIAFSEKSC